MGVVEQVVIAVLGAAVFAGLGYVASRVTERARTHRRLGHVYALLEKAAARITVVFPRSALPTPGRPENTVWMSLTDGAAIARIGVLCREVHPKIEMVLVHPDKHQPQDGPFVMIGNPGDTAWSAEWIDKNFPSLKSSPEEHRVSYRGTTWEPMIENDKVTRDYGFIIVGTIANSRCALLWGAGEFGANIATRAYSDLSAHDVSEDTYKGVKEGESWLFVATAQIVDYGVRTEDGFVQLEGTHQGVIGQPKQPRLGWFGRLVVRLVAR